MIAVHITGSEMPTLAKTQIYGLQKHFILSVDIAKSASARDCPTKRKYQLRIVFLKYYLCGNINQTDLKVHQ